MRIYFKTNLDVYRHIDWQNLRYTLQADNIVPRVNESIAIPKQYESYCKNKNIPTRLNVVEVTYHEDHISVELWYNDTDYKLYNMDGKLLERS